MVTALLFLLVFSPAIVAASRHVWRLVGPEREVDRGGFGTLGEQHWGSRGG